MYVCVCNKVTDHQIRRAVDDGIDSMDALSRELGVATCCGRCKDCAKRVLYQAKAERFALDDMLVLA